MPPGYDGIDNIIFCNICSADPELILYLVNRRLELGLFPTCFKIGVVLLFYKEGKAPENPMSYRPISLLPTEWKLLVKLMTQSLCYELPHKSKRGQSVEPCEGLAGWVRSLLQPLTFLSS
ncbi:hypothetical protein AVEN_82553-1 [Araneus ventricosus]|uniref:Reverse transcriptase domain-containing protein n=1 Tax=Araneus ventricosus TaxID=182803 RepID=A0A4Y2RYR3_ARAVE|nr:hypothetical protein AVEN_82553-1 [Araneus ventricosus]